MWYDGWGNYEEEMGCELDDPTYYGATSCYCGTCVYWEPCSVGATSCTCSHGYGFTGKHDKCSLGEIEEW